MVPSQARLGALFIVVFNLLSAAKAVYVGKLVQGVPSIIVGFWSFGIAAGLFLLLHGASLRQLGGKVSRCWKSVVALNVFTAGAWLSYFYALRYIEPAIHLAVVFAIGPAVMALFWRRLRPSQPVLPAEKVAAAGVFVSVLFLGVTVVSGKSSFVGATLSTSLFGLACAVASGFCSVGVTLTSKRVAEAGIDAKGVMALRFWLFLAACYLLWPTGQPALSLPAHALVPILIISIAGVVLPQMAVQMGISRSEPITVALLFAMNPALSYALQLFDHRLTPSPLSLIGIGASVLFSIYGAKARLGALRPTVRAQSSSASVPAR